MAISPSPTPTSLRARLGSIARADGTLAIAAMDQRNTPHTIRAAAELTERNSWNGEPGVHRDPARFTSWVREMGDDTVKLLGRLRPDRVRQPGKLDLAVEVVEAARVVIKDCGTVEMPSVLKAHLYLLPGGRQPMPASAPTSSLSWLVFSPSRARTY